MVHRGVSQMTCARCGRGHSGLCGIPSSVTRRALHSPEVPEVKARTHSARPKRDLLIESALLAGREHERRVIDMLNQLQKAGIGIGQMAEYDRLVEQLDQTQDVIRKATAKLLGRQ